jgi:hypothetical protein
MATKSYHVLLATQNNRIIVAVQHPCEGFKEIRNKRARKLAGA